MGNMLFDGWSSLFRTLVIGVLAYGSLVIILRVSGKRTLSKLNAFDFVITVALGSTLASVLTSKEISLAQGVLALTLLVAMQFVVTWTSVRQKRFRELVKSEPTLLVYQGKPLLDAMQRQRISLDEVQGAMRSSGLHAIQDVDAVILETDGSLNVIPKTGNQHATYIAGISSPEQ